MNKLWKRAVIVLMIGITMVLSACNDQDEDAVDTNDSNGTNTTNMANHTNGNHENLNNPDIIPSENSDKTRTTNENGATSSGMGQNIYSSIGSSGIHEGGVSSYFESILEGVGITGVKVFVVDDSVVLARNKQQTTSHEYDDMQRDLLSGTEGMSGKGEMKGIKDNGPKTFDNLDQAKSKMNEMFNGNVKILTVTNPKAVDLIEGIKENIMDSSYEAASEELVELLNMAK
ncbi:hypothetical protein [Virgibacillus oceani]|uniref:Sporulation protein n=1 Tax=Virgibacillus oceani TaxID=1479511 RepID=A0A917M9Y6_9BACI|nr:hypothetical protein [Virgibacillus oceani]GGG87100.1 hypothetical protein GCM10011398_36170 [Virgibacillus oceani]